MPTQIKTKKTMIQLMEISEKLAERVNSLDANESIQVQAYSLNDLKAGSNSSKLSIFPYKDAKRNGRWFQCGANSGHVSKSVAEAIDNGEAVDTQVVQRVFKGSEGPATCWMLMLRGLSPLAEL